MHRTERRTPATKNQESLLLNCTLSCLSSVSTYRSYCIFSLYSVVGNLTSLAGNEPNPTVYHAVKQNKFSRAAKISQTVAPDEIRNPLRWRRWRTTTSASGPVGQPTAVTTCVTGKWVPVRIGPSIHLYTFSGNRHRGTSSTDLILIVAKNLEIYMVTPEGLHVEKRLDYTAR